MFEILEEWIAQIPPGRALDLGAGDGHISVWMSDAGFEVDAVEMDLVRFERIKDRAANRRINPIHADIQSLSLGHDVYSLIVASSILHFLKPSDLSKLAPRLVRSLKPGGYLVCEVFTVDDPEFHDLISRGTTEAEANSFVIPGGGVITFFPSGALKDLFDPLNSLLYEEYRRISPDAIGGFRAGALLLAQRENDPPPEE